MCEKRWKSLRDRFVTELHNLDGPSGSAETQKSTWPLFDSMSFLTRRQSKINLLKPADSVVDCTETTTPADEALESVGEQINKWNERFLQVPRRNGSLIKILKTYINVVKEKKIGDVDELFAMPNISEMTPEGSRTRRALNKILLGQGGLQNGDKMMDRMVEILGILVKAQRYKKTFVPNEIRAEILEIVKLIFSGYYYENYAEMIKQYKELPIKNRMKDVNLDALMVQWLEIIDYKRYRLPDNDERWNNNSLVQQPQVKREKLQQIDFTAD